MEVCSNGHDEIVHNDYRGCPVCVLKAQFEEELRDRNREIDELKAERDALLDN